MIDDVARMMAEIINRQPAPKHESAERRKLRREMTREIRAIEAKGGTAEIPSEMA